MTESNTLAVSNTAAFPKTLASSATKALKLFETSRKQWQRDLGVEPEVELLREHQRILSLM